MCKEQDVRVKKGYLMMLYPNNSYTYYTLNESCKDCFTLDEFLKFRKCVHSNIEWWDERDILVSESLFNKALELQKNVECNSSKQELGLNDELQYHLTRSIELLNNKSTEFCNLAQDLTKIKNKLSNN